MYNILNNSQLGFREGHSTTFALSEFVEGVLSTFDKGEMSCDPSMLAVNVYCRTRAALIHVMGKERPGDGGDPT